MLAVAIACSASEATNPPRGSNPNGTGATGGTINLGDGGEGEASSTGGTTSIGVGNNTGEGGDGYSFGGACAADVTKGELIPLDVHIMLDTSLSMLEATGFGKSKWDDVKAALEAFLTDEGSDGIGVGIQYFPLAAAGVPTSCLEDSECGNAGPCNVKFCANNPNIVYCTGNNGCGPFGPCINLANCSANPLYICNNPGDSCGLDASNNDLGTCTTAEAGTCEGSSSCDVADYSVAAEDIQLLPEGADVILDSINAKDPYGNTPTAAALQGAVNYAYEWAQDHPDHQVVTLLATDGFPTQCAPTDFPLIATIAQNALESSPSISTYVIGVFPPGTAGAQENLDLIADAGGTDHAFIIDTSQDVAAQFLAALNTIRGSKLVCEFKVPEPEAGEELDYDGKVNVQFSSGNSSEVLPYVGSADNCGITEGGWYYDVDPSNGGTPTKILICPSTCEAFQGIAGGQVEVALGCETVTTVVK